MARPCSICTHPEKAGIDAALAGGDPFRGVARRFAVGADAVERHAKTHVATALSRAAAARQEDEALEADSLLERLRRAHREAWSVLDEAKKSKDPELVLKALTRVERQLELEARLLGELQEAPTVNLVVSGEWLSLRVVLLAALEPFPQARLAVVEALRARAS